MARLIFANENERNNNDQSTSSIAANDNNKCKNAIVVTKPAADCNNTSKTKMTTTSTTAVLTVATSPKKNNNVVFNGFKVRHPLSQSHVAASADNVYAAKKVFVAANSTVARLASKFNATTGSTVVNRSLGERFRQTVAVSPASKKVAIRRPITVRNSSVLEAIRFFEKDAATAMENSNGRVVNIGHSMPVHRIQQKSNGGCSVVDQNCISDGNHLTPVNRPPSPKDRKIDRNASKPSLQPKPVAILQSKVFASVGKENRSSGAVEEANVSPSPFTDAIDVDSVPAVTAVVASITKRVVENSHYHAPKLLLRQEKNANAVSDYQVIVAKSKRLSIAKDFVLESVLNDDDACNQTGCGNTSPLPAAKPASVDFQSCDENATIKLPNKTAANHSFLHKYLEQCLESCQTRDTIKDGEKSSVPLPSPPLPPPKENDTFLSAIIGHGERVSAAISHAPKNGENSSVLHDSLVKSLNHLATGRKNENSGVGHDDDDVVYEDLQSPKADDEHPYTVIKDTHGVDSSRGDDRASAADHHTLSVGNVYDDVIYAQLYHNAEVEDYETIASDVYCSLPANDPIEHNSTAAPEAISRSASDSSFEQANSLYDLKPTSDFSSATASTFSSSNDCINIKIESPYVYVANTKSSSSDIGDDEIIDDWDSDENDQHEEIIVYTKRSTPNRKKKFKKRKFKFLLRQKNNIVEELPPPVIEESTNIMDDLYDDFDDSSSDLESAEMNGHVEAVNHLNKSPSATISHSQNIYGLVEKARKTVRKSWSSLNQIRKLSVGNISNNFPLKIAETQSNRPKSVSVEEINVKNGHSVGSTGSVRWTSFKSKFRPRYSTINSSTSIFYLNPEDLRFDKNDVVNRKQNNVNNRRRRMTCIELRPTRPTSPPPPPPVDRPKFTDTQSVSNSNIYSDRSNSSYESRNSISGADTSFDLNSSRSSDLHLRFADEPLYQFYAESVVKLTTNASMDCLTDSDGYEEIASTTSRPSAMELIIPSPNGHGQHRTLWCEVDEVKNSGILETLSPGRQRLQEAMFEIITSEASYYKSLSVLDKIFSSNPLLKDDNLLTKSDWKILFGNVAAVRKCSEKLLAALEACWQESILLTGLCNVIYKHASENFRIYVKYCSNQIYIDRTLKTLREQNPKFTELISQLEANPICQSLSLHSFLMLPMQRITRMPLLIDAVLSKMDPLTDSEVYKTYQITLATLNKIVKECNETARKLERYEEMLLLSGQLEFSRKDVKMFSVASSSRWLIRSGPMVHINPQDIKLTFTRKLTKQTTKFYFFLFNDILVVAKKKSDDTYVVFDYCARNMIQMSLLDDNCASAYKYLLMLTILENHEGKTVEMILSCDSDSTRQRWLEATSSHLTSDNPEEKLYAEWDCPQVSAIHAYTAVQPDELSLQAGDVVKVLKKTTDGWCHGERIRDGLTGWFPGNYTVEIASQHMRAKNLRLRHRLLTLSGNYLHYQQLQKKS